MQICLIAILGTGLLCGGGNKATAVSDFCALAKADIERLQRLSAEEVAALQRPRKEAIASLRRTMKRECK